MLGGQRVVRGVGTLFVVAGVATLGWTLLVWQWQDPFTYLYNAYEQHQLAHAYAQRVERFTAATAPAVQAPPTRAKARPDAASATRQARLTTLAVSARRYRLASSPGEAVGRLRIGRLGLDVIVVDGTDHDALIKGPGLDRRSFMPGEGKLVYIAGHRTTYGAPFAHLDALRRGDRVSLEVPYGTFVYEVTGHVVVRADDLSVLRSRNHEVLALQACHPRFFATHRYIVYARPVSILPRVAPGVPTSRGASTGGIGEERLAVQTGSQEASRRTVIP